VNITEQLCLLNIMNILNSFCVSGSDLLIQITLKVAHRDIERSILSCFGKSRHICGQLIANTVVIYNDFSFSVCENVYFLSEYDHCTCELYKN
jgi:hypothetical protein